MAKVTPLKKQAIQSETETVVIKPPRLRYGTVMIEGTAPYIQNRFSSENREKMVAQQQAGSSSKPQNSATLSRSRAAIPGSSRRSRSA